MNLKEVTPENVYFLSIDRNLTPSLATQWTFSILSAGFRCEIQIQRCPKFNIIAAILNSNWKPGHVFVMSFHLTDVFQMASDMPFYYGNHKFNILAAILNSTWEPGRVFVTSFHPRDFSQMASDMPFNYHKLLKVTTTFRISSLWGKCYFQGEQKLFYKVVMNELFWFYEIKKKTEIRTWNAILHSSSNLCCWILHVHIM